MGRALTSKERLAWCAVSAVVFLFVYFIVVPILLAALPTETQLRIMQPPFKTVMSTYQVPVA